MTNLESVMKDIDWELLREQKAYLFNEANNNRDAEEVCEGLLNLLDNLQYAVVADGLASAEEVFGEPAQ